MLRAWVMGLLLCGCAAAQRQQPAPPAPPLTFDATVIGADGRPVAGLTSKDFELTHRGETREIESVMWVAEPASVVVVVDDLGLSPERVAALQQTLRGFVSQLKPEDRAGLVRASSGSGWQQTLTTDRTLFLQQIERLQPIVNGISDASAVRGLWECIRWALDGLPADDSRKALVLLAEPAHLAALEQNETLISPAHYAKAVFYFVDPSPTSKFVDLAKQTGGSAVPDLSTVLREQGGYYKITFRPAREGMYYNPPALRLQGTAGTVRWRSGYPSESTPLLDKPTPSAGGDLRVDLTALYTGFERTNSQVEVIAHVDGRDISTMRDLKGIRHGGVDIELIPYVAGGRAPGSFARHVDMDLDEEKYQQLLRSGVQISTRVMLPVSSGYQIRAVVTDGRSGRVGSAMEFLDIPPASGGVFAITGLLLRDAEKAADSQYAPIFAVGATVDVVYGVMNATQGPEKEKRLRIHTRIYAGPRLVYDGAPTDLAIPPGPPLSQLRTKLHLDSHLSPGTYAVQVECTDMLANDAGPRVTRQSGVFQIRE